VEVEPSVRLVEEPRERLDAQDFDGLRERAERTHAADLAAALRELPLDDRVAVFRQLTRETSGAVLSELDDETLLVLVRALDRAEVSGILDRMPPDEAAYVVETLPEEQAHDHQHGRGGPGRDADPRGAQAPPGGPGSRDARAGHDADRLRGLPVVPGARHAEVTGFCRERNRSCRGGIISGLGSPAAAC
jgi:MgtE intracellular N domain